MEGALEKRAVNLKRNSLPAAAAALPVFSDSSAETEAARVTVLISLGCDGDDKLLRLVLLYFNVLDVDGVVTTMTGTTKELVSTSTFVASSLST